jgi:hypothetical protein
MLVRKLGFEKKKNLYNILGLNAVELFIFWKFKTR